MQISKAPESLDSLDQGKSTCFKKIQNSQKMAAHDLSILSGLTAVSLGSGRKNVFLPMAKPVAQHRHNRFIMTTLGPSGSLMFGANASCAHRSMIDI
jgi:hypothetical protein